MNPAPPVTRARTRRLYWSRTAASSAADSCPAGARRMSRADSARAGARRRRARRRGRHSGCADANAPKVSARAWVALDADTGRVLLAQRAHERRPIASLTKMTGLLVAEAGALGGRVTVPLAATLVEPTNEGCALGGATGA